MDNHRGNSEVLDKVFATPEKLTEAVVEHHTILNLGQDHLLDEAWNIHQAFQQCLEAHCDGMSERDAIKCVEGEKKSWMKDAKKQVALVVKAGMPLTIRSADSFFPLPTKKSPKK